MHQELGAGGPSALPMKITNEAGPRSSERQHALAHVIDVK
jgi:hypothetical protein